MTNTVRYWAVIPAAGTGQRFSANISHSNAGDSTLRKQYAPLGSSTVIEHSIAALEAGNVFSGLVVAVDPEDTQFDQLSLVANKLVTRVDGAETRALSVLRGLQYLQTVAGANDFVLVHDAARPLLHKNDLNNLLYSLCDDEIGGVLAVRITDTIKQVRSENKPELPKQAGVDLNTVETSLNRDTLWAAQTPQMFRFGKLLKALESIVESEGADKITDEASAMELQGYKVKLLESQHSNFKITRAEDLALAEFYLSRRNAKSGN